MTKRKQKQTARVRLLEWDIRIRALLQSGRIKSASEIPKDAIPAAVQLQNPSGTWSPPLFYRDYPFTCKDCGKHEVWTATQQRWYYEVAKGSVLGQANRCRPCRKKRRDEIKKQRALLEEHKKTKARRSSSLRSSSH